MDDINIYLQNQPARLFASQGQQRNIAVSLKISQVLVFKEILGFYPLLLLDEVLADSTIPEKPVYWNILIMLNIKVYLLQ